jgi:hypothetical protein
MIGMMAKGNGGKPWQQHGGSSTNAPPTFYTGSMRDVGSSTLEPTDLSSHDGNNNYFDEYGRATNLNFPKSATNAVGGSMPPHIQSVKAHDAISTTFPIMNPMLPFQRQAGSSNFQMPDLMLSSRSFGPPMPDPFGLTTVSNNTSPSIHPPSAVFPNAEVKGDRLPSPAHVFGVAQSKDMSPTKSNQMVDMNLPFPVKLHRILSKPEYKEYIAWLPHGRAWRILTPKAFEDVVIPKFFRSTKYASFMRQVRIGPNDWS